MYSSAEGVEDISKTCLDSHWFSIWFIDTNHLVLLRWRILYPHCFYATYWIPRSVKSFWTVPCVSSLVCDFFYLSLFDRTVLSPVLGKSQFPAFLLDKINVSLMSLSFVDPEYELVLLTKYHIRSEGTGPLIYGLTHI